MPIYVALRSATRTSPPLRTRRTEGTLVARCEAACCRGGRKVEAGRAAHVAERDVVRVVLAAARVEDVQVLEVLVDVDGRVHSQHVILPLPVNVRVCGPHTMIPKFMAELDVEVSHDLNDTIVWADALNMLRIQLERQGDDHVVLKNALSEGDDNSNALLLSLFGEFGSWAGGDAVGGSLVYDLLNLNDMQYEVEITVGTQEFTVVPDTGSSDLWLQSSSAPWHFFFFSKVKK